MRIKLAVSDGCYPQLRAELESLGIEVDDNAELILTQRSSYPDWLMAKDNKTNERVLLPMEDIVLLESYGHRVDIYTGNEVCQSSEPLYQLLQLLDPDKFLRVSNCAVIAKSHVRRISPTLSMKFILTMSNDKRVDVTRSYYYIFKDAFGI